MELFENENEKLKIFVQNNVPFSHLKKAGLFPKEMKFNNYAGITKIFLDHVGCKTPEEYTNDQPEWYPDDSFVSGKFPDKINENGELKMGSGFHISWAQKEYDIICCICECKQTANVSTSTNTANKKCKGCKRKIAISVSKDRISVSER